MANEIKQVASPAFDLKIEPPSPIDTALPNTAFGVDNLRTQRRVTIIVGKETKRLFRPLLDIKRSFSVASLELRRADKAHSATSQGP